MHDAADMRVVIAYGELPFNRICNPFGSPYVCLPPKSHRFLQQILEKLKLLYAAHSLYVTKATALRTLAPKTIRAAMSLHGPAPREVPVKGGRTKSPNASR
jgi:hypothetical protein